MVEKYTTTQLITSDFNVKEAPTISTNLPWINNAWKALLKNNITSLSELLSKLHINKEDLNISEEGIKQFPISVTQHFVKLMEIKNTNDPLFLQIFADKEESNHASGYSQDPLHENTTKEPYGIIHKYKGRLLLVLTGACAIHCRYCFRRHFDYKNHQLTRKLKQDLSKYLFQKTDLNEIILSGGDPLTLDTNYLKEVLAPSLQLKQIKRLRFHTRTPVVLPQRIDTSFIDWIQSIKQQIIMVLHINHPKEISPELQHAVLALKQVGVTVFNQSVLLKNINDTSQIQCNLQEKLFECGIIPYYLSVLDKVQGAHHYNVSVENAKYIIQEVQKQLPGYMVPKLVAEIPDRDSKTLIPINRL